MWVQLTFRLYCPDGLTLLWTFSSSLMNIQMYRGDRLCPMNHCPVMTFIIRMCRLHACIFKKIIRSPRLFRFNHIDSLTNPHAMTVRNCSKFYLQLMKVRELWSKVGNWIQEYMDCPHKSRLILIPYLIWPYPTGILMLLKVLRAYVSNFRFCGLSIREASIKLSYKFIQGNQVK